MVVGECPAANLPGGNTGKAGEKQRRLRHLMAVSKSQGGGPIWNAIDYRVCSTIYSTGYMGVPKNQGALIGTVHTYIGPKVRI